MATKKIPDLPAVGALAVGDWLLISREGVTSRAPAPEGSDGGTVTSVGVSLPTGFQVANTPITGSGTITITFASGYDLPTTAAMGQWSTAVSWGDHALAGYALASTMTSALAGKVDISDTRLTNSREWTAATIEQTEAEAGAATTRRAWTSQRVRQAIAAWWAGTAEKLKIDGIQAGATANQTDVYLLARANQTGTQSAATIAGLATVATSGSYADLSDKPSIPAAQVPADWSAVSGAARILNKPTLGTAAAAATSDFATAAQGGKADTALQPSAIGVTVQGYSAALAGSTASFTSALLTKLNGIATGATANATDAALRARSSHTGTQLASTITGLAAVATSGSYADLANKPTIPAGTVTSVQVATPNGLSVSGGPVTTSGTLTISYASGYAIPTTAKQGQWDTAYGWGNHAAAGYAASTALNAYLPKTGGTLTGPPVLNNTYLESSDTWGMKWKFAGNSDTVSMDPASTSWLFNIASGGVTKYRFNASKDGFGPIVDFGTDGSATFYGNLNVNGDSVATESWVSARTPTAHTHTAAQVTGLAAAATTGSYNDLSDKPTLGTAAAASTADFATVVQGAKADTALQPAAIGVTVQGYSAALSSTTASFTTALKNKLDGIAAGATANTGTVTSVQVAMPTGLQASGGPVTSSGTITISYASGYAIPTTAKQGQWDTAYGWGNHAVAGYVTPTAMSAFTYSKQQIDDKIDAGGGGGAAETYPYRGVLTTEDLNNVREAGVYGQPATPNATLERNYPANIAGALEVLVLNADTTPYPIVTQRYTTNEGTQRIFIRRGGAVGGWSAWREITIGAGSMAYRDATISTSDPSGGANGDVWFKV